MKTTGKITHHWQLDVYKLSVEVAMRLFELTKRFPREKLVKMQNNPDVWLLPRPSRRR